MTVWLLERSLKTLNIRVKEQTKNALVMATYLRGKSHIERVYYPGLKSHPQSRIGKNTNERFWSHVVF